MTTNRRHTNAEIRAAIDALEARGWSINDDGTITRTEARQLRHDPWSKNAELRYLVGRTTIKRSDLVTAKFGLVAAKEQPDAQVVDLRLDSEPEPQPVAAQRGPCGHCGGFMARSDPDEHRCLQCGRTGIPPLRWGL